MYLYDITKGDNITDALKILNEKSAADLKPLYSYPLMGPTSTTPATKTGWHVTKDADGKDEMLTIYTASADAGFVIFDFPKSTLTD